MKKIFSLSLMAIVAVLSMAQSYPERVYLCGPAGPGWEKHQMPMYTNLNADGLPDGTYEWVGDLNDGDLKLLHGGDWEPGYASSADEEEFTAGDHTVVDRLTNDDPDNKWTVTAGRYKMNLNVATMTLTVSDGTDLEAVNGDNQLFLYMIGDGSSFGWSLSEAGSLAITGENTFEGDFTLKATGEMKFLCQRDWGLHYGPVEKGEEITGAGTYSLARHETDDYKYKSGLTEDTQFHFVLDLTAGTMVLTSEETTALKDNAGEVKVEKMMVNGQFVILKNGVRYNVLGAKF